MAIPGGGAKSTHSLQKVPASVLWLLAIVSQVADEANVLGLSMAFQSSQTSKIILPYMEELAHSV